jgi:type I restriction enzyme S subunit
MSKAKYPTYKPSKTLWQEQIPSHWQETELRMLFADNKNKNLGLVERNLLSLSYGKLKRKDIDNATGLVPASFEGYQIIDEGYIVLRFTDLQNDKKSLRVGYANEKGIITNAYVGLAPKADIHSKYYYYQLHFLDKIKYFYNLGGGVRQSLAYKEFGRETVLIPDKEEQTVIAAFLDFKLTKIDRFIRKKKQLIKLLNEQKVAIINKAVTKGLNPKVKMKPSGIEWLGSIPEHWEVKRLKYCCSKITDGSHFSPETKPDGIPYITVSDIGDNTIDLIFSKKISENDYLDLKKNGCQPNINDILLTKDGTIGRAAVVSFNSKFVILSSLGLLTPLKDVFPNYLRNYLVSDICVKEMKSKIQGSALTRLTISLIKNINIIIPPSIKEQQQIVDFIEDESLIINKTIATIEKEIALVEEYKTSLIAEAVTGKIDVRDFEIPEMVEEDSYEELEEELSLAAEDEAEYQTVEE